MHEDFQPLQLILSRHESVPCRCFGPFAYRSWDTGRARLTALFTNPAAGRPPDKTAPRARSPIDGMWPFFLLYEKQPVAQEPPDW